MVLSPVRAASVLAQQRLHVGEVLPVRQRMVVQQRNAHRGSAGRRAQHGVVSGDRAHQHPPGDGAAVPLADALPGSTEGIEALFQRQQVLHLVELQVPIVRDHLVHRADRFGLHTARHTQRGIPVGFVHDAQLSDVAAGVPVEVDVPAASGKLLKILQHPVDAGHVLLHAEVERRHQSKRQAGQHAEGAESHSSSAQQVGFLAVASIDAERQSSAVSSDEHAPDQHGREIRQRQPGAVGAGADGAADALVVDVAEVRHRKPGSVKLHARLGQACAWQHVREPVIGVVPGHPVHATHVEHRVVGGDDRRRRVQRSDRTDAAAPAAR